MKQLGSGTGKSRTRIRERAVRARLDIEATYQVLGARPRSARICELSRTGLKLRIDRQLAIGTSLEIAFDPGVAADPCRQKPTRVKIRGRIVRVVATTGTGFMYGIDLRIDKETGGALQWLALLMYANEAPPPEPPDQQA